MTLNLYRVQFVVGDEGMPGAPLLHVAALVDAPTGRITGLAEITQAIAPPNDVIQINHLKGRVHSLGFGPGRSRAVVLQGSYTFSFPPPAIGEGTAPFTATLLIEEDSWTGRGSFSYGGKTVEDVPVSSKPDNE